VLAGCAGPERAAAPPHVPDRALTAVELAKQTLAEHSAWLTDRNGEARLPRVLDASAAPPLPASAEVLIIHGFISHHLLLFRWESGHVTVQHLLLNHPWVYDRRPEFQEAKTYEVAAADFVRTWQAARLLLSGSTAHPTGWRKNRPQMIASHEPDALIRFLDDGRPWITAAAPPPLAPSAAAPVLVEPDPSTGEVVHRKHTVIDFDDEGGELELAVIGLFWKLIDRAPPTIAAVHSWAPVMAAEIGRSVTEPPLDPEGPREMVAAALRLLQHAPARVHLPMLDALAAHLDAATLDPFYRDQLNRELERARRACAAAP
jgi:hypothetical protein